MIGLEEVSITNHLNCFQEGLANMDMGAEHVGVRAGVICCLLLPVAAMRSERQSHAACMACSLGSPPNKWAWRERSEVKWCHAV